MKALLFLLAIGAVAALRRACSGSSQEDLQPPAQVINLAERRNELHRRWGRGKSP